MTFIEDPALLASVIALAQCCVIALIEMIGMIEMIEIEFEKEQ